MDKRNAIIVLNIIIIIMSAMWALLSIVRGVDWFELVYIYLHHLLVLTTLILNLIILFEKKKDDL